MGGPGPKTVTATPAKTTEVMNVLRVIEVPMENDFAAIEIIGKIEEAIARPGLEKKYPSPKAVGLPNYDRYHLAGPSATGAEEGIVYASRKFNIGKTARIENIMRNARKYSKVNGGEAYIRVRAIVKNWKTVDGVTIRVLKEIEWTIDFRMPGTDKVVKLVDAERYYLKPPEAEPKLFAKYVPKRISQAAGSPAGKAAGKLAGKAGSVAFMAAPIVAGYLHGKAVEKRVEKQVKEQGYVAFDAPSEEGFFYDLAAWFIDPFKDAEFSIGIEKRFDIVVWRTRFEKLAASKKPGEIMEIAWDVGTCQQDFLGRQVIEQRKIKYQKLPDGGWKTLSGDDAGTPDINYILSPEVTDGEVMSELFTDPCAA